MDRINYLRLNPQRYEQHLSPFGIKVLQVLMKHSVGHRDKARHQTYKNQYEYRPFSTQSKKVLIFNDRSVSEVETSFTPLIPLPIPTTSSQISPEIPRTLELIQTVTRGHSKHDFLHETLAANRNLVYNIYNECDNDNALDEENFNTIKTTKNAVVSTNINWDNILDSELLVDVANNEPDNKTNDNPTGKKRKIKPSTDPKLKKVRIRSSAIKNQHKPREKKTVIVSSPQNNNFRKQKYTKAVKNWLDNIDLQQPVEGDLNNIASCDIDNNHKSILPETDKPGIDSIENKVNLNDETTKITDKMVLKTGKKVVQAQLANKDGVMKYSKPKDFSKESKEGTNNIENQQKNSKGKTIKKFEPPIKSQIPVKDVRYEVYNLNENNIENYLDKLHEIKHIEIVAVLIFSNGFCQLNSNYTENSCTPDAIIINSGDIFYYFNNAGERLKESLKYILENNQIVCYGARNILIYLASLKMGINSINMYDAKIGCSLLDPDNPSENFTDLQKMLSFTAPFTIATECTLQKCAWYMSLLKECWAKLHGMLVEDSLWKVFVDIEMKLLPIIADMEVRGVSIDMTKLKAMEDVLVKRMRLTEQQCYKAAGRVFQINSAMQVRTILYDELQLDTKSNVKIRETLSKGAKSTSESMLRSLITEHPLPKLILEYRHLHKAHATFLAGIAHHVKDGIVHPTWVHKSYRQYNIPQLTVRIQTAAATGRIASNNPNLQAIPKAPYKLVMYPEGDDSETEQLLFRSVYVSGERRCLLAADFSHVECRVFAAAAADGRLQAALAAPTDLFKLLASQWLKKPETDVGDEERERTKKLVYASLYGAGTRKLMEILNVDYQQALQVSVSFNRTFPSLKSFGRSVVSRCRAASGRVTSLCGRMRTLHNIDSPHLELKAQAERQAVNFIVQGSAADLCKIAMIMCEERLRGSTPPVDAHLVLQIHDELVWEVHDQHVDRAAVVIKQVMEGCGRQCGLAVTLPVAISVGKNWGQMHDYTQTQ